MTDFDMLRRLMDEFMECDMDFDTLEQEFERHFAALEQEFYREFFHTLKKTVELCHNMECCPPPETLHISLFQAIEHTPQVKSLHRKPKAHRKR